jgi:hypothetical protein
MAGLSAITLAQPSSPQAPLPQCFPMPCQCHGMGISTLGEFVDTGGHLASLDTPYHAISPGSLRGFGSEGIHNIHRGVLEAPEATF